MKKHKIFLITVLYAASIFLYGFQSYATSEPADGITGADETGHTDGSDASADAVYAGDIDSAANALPADRIIAGDTAAGLAARLRELGMFMGVGENPDGTVNFDLNRAPTRCEAIIMLIRALGKDAAANAYPPEHPFSDVPAWAGGYVAYAYDNGLANGVSGTLFGADAGVSAEMYLTFSLRALGYSDGEDGDFLWDSPRELAARCGILPADLNGDNFLRADAVYVTCMSFFAKIKGTETFLYGRLIAEGAFTEAQFTGAFPENPFSGDQNPDRPDTPEDSGKNENSAPAYEESLQTITGSGSFVTVQSFETEQCTVLYGVLGGTSHGAVTCFYLIYKPGSDAGEGVVKDLPLPYINAFGTQAAPEGTYVSEDGLTLYYSVRFGETVKTDGQLIHEAGTYRYTVDLTTGEPTLAITAE